MPKLRRGRASQAGESTVRIVSKSVSLARYREVLLDNVEYLAYRLGARPPATEEAFAQAVRALTCGRIVAGKSSSNMERCQYCRAVPYCRCCKANHAMTSATQLVDDPTKNYGKKLLGIVVTLPDPPDTAASRDMAVFANEILLPAIRKTLTAWKRRIGQEYQLGSYAIGLHLKHRSTGRYWPHLHIAVFTDRRCRMNELKEYIRISLEHVFDPKPVPHIKVQSSGVLGKYRSDQESRQRKRAIICTSTKAKALFAYIFRTAENDESACITAERDRFIDEVLQQRKCTRSRSTTSKRHGMPCEFDPFALGKSHVYYFPLDAGPPQKIDASDYRNARAQLADDATRLITRWLSDSSTEP